MRVMEALNSVFDVFFSNVVDLVLELNFFSKISLLSVSRKKTSWEKGHSNQRC